MFLFNIVSIILFALFSVSCSSNYIASKNCKFEKQGSKWCVVKPCKLNYSNTQSLSLSELKDSNFEKINTFINSCKILQENEKENEKMNTLLENAAQYADLKSFLLINEKLNTHLFEKESTNLLHKSFFALNHEVFCYLFYHTNIPWQEKDNIDYFVYLFNLDLEHSTTAIETIKNLTEYIIDCKPGVYLNTSRYSIENTLESHFIKDISSIIMKYCFYDDDLKIKCSTLLVIDQINSNLILSPTTRENLKQYECNLI